MRRAKRNRIDGRRPNVEGLPLLAGKVGGAGRGDTFVMSCIRDKQWKMLMMLLDLRPLKGQCP